MLLIGIFVSHHVTSRHVTSRRVLWSRLVIWLWFWVCFFGDVAVCVLCLCDVKLCM